MFSNRLSIFNLTPILLLTMSVRPNVTARTKYGTPDSYWVEYPDGLVDMSRRGQGKEPKGGKLVEFNVQGERRVRIDTGITALVVVDMQK